MLVLKRFFPAPLRYLASITLVIVAAATTLGQQGDEVIDRMKKDINFLASEICEGRGVDTKGIDVAADYIINNIKKAGLKPGGKDNGWLQPFTIGGKGGAAVTGVNTLVLKGPAGQSVELKMDTDFKVLPISASGKAESPVVFAGYGLTVPKAEYDDFKGLDVKGKIVVVIRRVPRWDNDANQFAGDKNAHAGIETKITTVESNKPAAIIVVNDRSEDKDGDKFMAVDSNSPANVPVVQLRRGVLDMMFVSGQGKKLTEVEADIDRDLKPRSGPITGWTADLTTNVNRTGGILCKNVVGVLEGSGPLANETVCITSHYDHLGWGQGKGAGKGGKAKSMYPGADDNGSGSTTNMEVARRFGAIKNRQGRRLVFIWFSAEERGLLGSKAYCKEPLFPLESTVLCMNMDMVGRLKDVKEPELYAEGFNSGTGLQALLTKLNGEFGFKIVGPHKQGIYGRSDQASFYAKRVPGVFFFTDFHSDYHKPGDTADKINVAGMAKIANLVEKIVTHVSTTSEPPVYVAGAIPKKAAGGGKKDVVGKLNLTPDPTDKSDKGLLVASVADNGAAAKAGLKAGDRITAIGNAPTPNQTTYLSAVQTLRVGVVVELTIQRDGKEMKLKVTPQ